MIRRVAKLTGRGGALPAVSAAQFGFGGHARLRDGRERVRGTLFAIRIKCLIFGLNVETIPIV